TGVHGDFQPTVAVNNQGVVGFLYYRAPGADGRIDSSDVYFTASIDGGRTLLPSVRVSSQTSQPHTTGNLALMHMWTSSGKNGISSILSTQYVYHAEGGDYVGLDSDSSGVFHPFWTDSRSGVYQVYTTDIFTGSTAEAARARAAAFRETARFQSLDGKTSIVFDPERWDEKTGDLILPIRLKNISNGIIGGRIVVTLTGDGLGRTNRPDAKFLHHQILNASNRKRTLGATFDYSSALGSLGFLSPQALSEP